MRQDSSEPTPNRYLSHVSLSNISRLIIKTSLELARSNASTDPQSRHFFDYLQAQQDISTIQQGIRRYLAPARAQPRSVQPLSASYQRENPDD
ncbi:RAQPRD family integrative conjugative element protein [Salmonella enterica]|nr:RAQPRD family integrative conjugative element protein [Salmonella enterica]